MKNFLHRFYKKSAPTADEKMMQRLTRIVTREVDAIDDLFAKHNIAAAVDRDKITASDTGGFVRYPIAASDKVSKVTAYEDDLAVLISGLRGVDVSIKIRRPRLMIELPFPLDRKILEWEDAPKTGKFQALVGMDYTGVDVVPVIIDWKDPSTSNVLVSGRTGSGKTNGLVLGILSLANGTSPSDAQIIILDPKFSKDIRPLGGLPHVTVLTEPEDCALAIAAVKAEVNRRKRRPDGRKIFLVAEEISEMMVEAGTDKRDLFVQLKSIAQIGREQGVHFIGCTQKAVVDVIDTVLRANLPIRVAFQVSTRAESEVATGLPDVDCVRLPGKGAGYFVMDGQARRIQSHFVDPELLPTIVGSIAFKWAGKESFRIAMNGALEDSGDGLPANVTQAQIDAILDKYDLESIFDGNGKPRRGIKTRIIRDVFGDDAPTGGTNDTWASSVLSYLTSHAGA